MAIPLQYLDQAARHLSALRNFNEQVARYRDLECRVGGSGRYECEFREKQEGLADAASAQLDHLEHLAQVNGEPLDALYQGQTRPAKEPWSVAAVAWRREPA